MSFLRAALAALAGQRCLRRTLTAATSGFDRWSWSDFPFPAAAKAGAQPSCLRNSAGEGQRASTADQRVNRRHLHGSRDAAGAGHFAHRAGVDPVEAVSVRGQFARQHHFDFQRCQLRNIEPDWRSDSGGQRSGCGHHRPLRSVPVGNQQLWQQPFRRRHFGLFDRCRKRCFDRGPGFAFCRECQSHSDCVHSFRAVCLRDQSRHRDGQRLFVQLGQRHAHAV